MKKIAENILYQGIYQFLQIVLPIITVPIISNALGPSGVGKFNYTNSITSYFVLVAGLGLANYGVREIASVREDKQKLSRKFWQLEGMNVLTAIVVLILFYVITGFLRYYQLYLIESLMVISALLDISWFFVGIEDFQKVSLANMFVKVFSFILILFLVRNESDLNVYVFIISFSTLVSQALLWIFLLTKISFVKVTFSEMIVHLLPALHYFISKIAISLYTNLNKTLLGIFSTAVFVGYYSNSLTFILMLATMMSTLDEVLLPRMSNLYANEKKESLERILKISIHTSLFVTIPMTFGILVTNNKIVSWFFGDKFIFIKSVVPFFSPLIIIIPLGVSIARQYLVPEGKIRNYNISVIAAAVVSVIINVILIPKIGIWGAVIATLTAESLNTIIRLIDLKTQTDFKFNWVLI
ncbi:flippase, partial [Liquorilactobacillus vini]